MKLENIQDKNALVFYLIFTCWIDGSWVYRTVCLLLACTTNSCIGIIVESLIFAGFQSCDGIIELANIGF
jgi:hypothetical protein